MKTEFIRLCLDLFFYVKLSFYFTRRVTTVTTFFILHSVGFWTFPFNFFSFLLRRVASDRVDIQKIKFFQRKIKFKTTLLVGILVAGVLGHNCRKLGLSNRRIFWYWHDHHNTFELISVQIGSLGPDLLIFKVFREKIWFVAVLFIFFSFPGTSF